MFSNFFIHKQPTPPKGLVANEKPLIEVKQKLEELKLESEDDEEEEDEEEEDEFELFESLKKHQKIALSS